MSRDLYLRKMTENRLRVHQVRDGKNVLLDNSELLDMMMIWASQAQKPNDPFCTRCHTIPCTC